MQCLVRFHAATMLRPLTLETYVAGVKHVLIGIATAKRMPLTSLSPLKLLRTLHDTHLEQKYPCLLNVKVDDKRPEVTRKAYQSGLVNFPRFSTCLLKVYECYLR